MDLFPGFSVEDFRLFGVSKTAGMRFLGSCKGFLGEYLPQRVLHDDLAAGVLGCWA